MKMSLVYNALKRVETKMSIEVLVITMTRDRGAKWFSIILHIW